MQLREPELRAQVGRDVVKAELRAGRGGEAWEARAERQAGLWGGRRGAKARGFWLPSAIPQRKDPRRTARGPGGGPAPHPPRTRTLPHCRYMVSSSLSLPPSPSPQLATFLKTWLASQRATCAIAGRDCHRR